MKYSSAEEYCLSELPPPKGWVLLTKENRQLIRDVSRDLIYPYCEINVVLRVSSKNSFGCIENFAWLASLGLDRGPSAAGVAINGRSNGDGKHVW